MIFMFYFIFSFITTEIFFTDATNLNRLKFYFWTLNLHILSRELQYVKILNFYKDYFWLFVIILLFNICLLDIM